MHGSQSIIKSHYTENNSFVFKTPLLPLYSEEFSIMIIDDSKRDIELFEELLREESTLNFTLSKWTIPQDALSALEKEMIIPDIIVLDLVMPGMNGTMILKRLKISQISKHIPVVIHSSMNNYGNIKNVAALDAHAFFSKPLEAEKFQKFLQG